MKKFVVSVMLCTLSLLITFYFMIFAQNTDINDANTEIRGINYENIIRILLEDISRHQILTSSYLLGNTSYKDEIFGLQQKINNEFKALINLDQELEIELGTTKDNLARYGVSNLKPASIEKKWANINQRIFDLSPKSALSLHKQLIDNVLDLGLFIETTSLAILDSEMDTYLLILAATKDLPLQAVNIAYLIAWGNQLISQHALSPEDRDNLIFYYRTAQKNISAIQNDVKKTIVFDKEKKLGSENETKLKGLLAKNFDLTEEFLAFIDKQILIPKTIETDPALLMNVGLQTFNSIFSLRDAVMNQAQKTLLEHLEHLKKLQKFSIISSLLAMILGFWFGLIIIRSISHSLNHLIKATKQLSNGDLSVRVPVTSNDEIGQVGNAFNQMAGSFQELIGWLQWAGIQLSTSTTEIAQAAKEQEVTIIAQEATTKQIALSASQISATAKEFAKTMNEVSNTAEKSSSIATSSKAGLTKMEGIMSQMVNASANIASKLAVLNEKAGTITSIISTIAKVADQTNLLSLNAAIEAEKAGEHGRSFSVIAREIRRLADQTANATVDIEKMVNEMVSAVSAGVMGVDKFSEEIHSGVTQLSIVSDQLSKIIGQVQQQTISYESVNKGMQTQSTGAEEIHNSINRLIESAQQSSHSIRHFHDAVKQLNHATDEMQNAVTKIKR